MGAISRAPIWLWPWHKGGGIAVERDLAFGTRTMALLRLCPLVIVIATIVWPSCSQMYYLEDRVMSRVLL